MGRNSFEIKKEQWEKAHKKPDAQTPDGETVLTLKIIVPKDRPLTRDFIEFWMEYLGPYQVVDFYHKGKKEEGEGCACQRSW